MMGYFAWKQVDVKNMEVFNLCKLFSLVINLCFITGVMGAIEVPLIVRCIVLSLLQMVALSSGMNLLLVSSKMKIWYKRTGY